MRPKLILGSASPRRRALLETLGVMPDDVRAPEIDETPRKREAPRSYCRRMAAEKAAAWPVGEHEILLSADTTVAMGRRILGKPADLAEAEAFLRALSGRRHRVITAVTVRRGARAWHRDVVSQVRMKVLSDDEMRGYLATDDWQGKAGGYAIQGPAAAFIPWMSGSHSSIMGLPLAETAALLQAAGYPIWKEVA